MTVKISALPSLSEAVTNSDLFPMVNVSVTSPDATGQTQRVTASELRTYIGGVTSVDLTAPAAGITVSGGPITTSGSITLALANDLAALEGLSGTNTIPYRSGSDTWGGVTIGSGLTFSGGTLAATGDGTGTVTSVAATAPAAGFTISGSPITTSGTFVFALADDLAAVEGLAGTGIAVRTAADTWAQRTITGTADKITVTNGDGVAGNPTLTIAATYVGQNTITTLGTVTTGTWNATPIATAYGGVPPGGPEAYSLVKATSGDYDVTWAWMQPNSTVLTAIAGVTPAADTIPLFTGLSTASTTALTSFARTILDDADAATVRTTIGAGTGNGTVTSVGLTQPAAGITVSGSTITTSGTFTLALANDLAAVEGLSGTGLATRTASDTWAARTITGTADKIAVTDGDGVSGNPTLTIASGYAGQTSITTLGTITTGTWTGTAIAVTNGGTGATDASTARTNLGLAIGSDVQAYDADLAAIAGLTSAADKGIYFTGAGTAATYDLTSFARTILDDADAATVRATIGAGTGNGTVTTASVVSANGFAGTVANATTTPAITLTTTVTGLLKGNGTTISAASSGTDYVIPSGNVATATALATARAIYGNDFDGTAALTQVIASTYGGTGNGFTKFTGPTTAERTFTLPDATATILTSNAAVTVAQGGTGATDASTARTNLGLAIGSDVQAYDADLAAIAALSGTNTIYYRSGASTWSAVTIDAGLSFAGGSLAATSVPGPTTGGALPVDAAATTNITRSGEQTIDGVALTTGMRVLLTGQSTPADNGIYTVSSGSWTRATDFPAGAAGAYVSVPVRQGTTYGNTTWRSHDPYASSTIGTDGLTFQRLFSGIPSQLTGTGTLTSGATGSGFTVALGTSTVTGTLGSANGGTGNGFTKFTGPTTAERTFTLPNASATILTTNAAVTVAQGGTGATDAATARTNLGIRGHNALGNISGNPVNLAVDTYERFSGTLTGNVTFAFTGDADGDSWLISVTQDGTGGRTITWPANMFWDSNTTPTQLTTASKGEMYAIFRKSSTHYRARRVWKEA